MKPADKMKPPPNCPFCFGQREWGVGEEADCMFCGRTTLVLPEVTAGKRGKDERE